MRTSTSAGLTAFSASGPRPHFSSVPGREILAEDVGGSDQAPEEGRALRLAQVEGDGLLVALLGEPGVAVAALARAAELAQRVAEPRLLDLDDLGAELAEDGGGERPGDEGREVDDADAAQRQLA